MDLPLASLILSQASTGSSTKPIVSSSLYLSRKSFKKVDLPEPILPSMAITSVSSSSSSLAVALAVALADCLLNAILLISDKDIYIFPFNSSYYQFYI